MPKKEQAVNVSRGTENLSLKNLVQRNYQNGPEDGQSCKKTRPFRLKNLKVYPLLLQAFEENKGWIEGEKLDELIKNVGGELTRRQIRQWFTRRREHLGRPEHLGRRNFSERRTALLERAFAENGGKCVSGERLVELAANGEFTKQQIQCWFYKKRAELGIQNSYEKSAKMQ